jgi:cell division protein FtsB
MNNNNKSKPNYIWSWLKIAFISIVFFSLMFLQVFQAKKVKAIQDEINTAEKEIMDISLELADVNLKIEKIRNSDIIDNIAVRGLGMVKVDKTKYKIIESNNEGK